MDMVYINKCRYEIQEKRFRYGIPVYTDPFRASGTVVHSSVERCDHCEVRTGKDIRGSGRSLLQINRPTPSKQHTRRLGSLWG
jgi:hypothetical protein